MALTATRRLVVKATAGAEASQGITPICGLFAAKMLSPLFPLRLNFTGIALPAFTTFSIGRLPTGEKKPVKM